jgi:hypothetical protein
MSYRGQSEDLGLNLDVYADADEATLRRPGVDSALEYYDEDDAPTIPWMGRVN